MFFLMGEQLAQACPFVVPPPTIHASIRQGRMIALQKPLGGVRGIVVGDAVRRPVARTMAQRIPLVEDVLSAGSPLALFWRARELHVEGGQARDGPWFCGRPQCRVVDMSVQHSERCGRWRSPRCGHDAVVSGRVGIEGRSADQPSSFLGQLGGLHCHGSGKAS